MKFIEDERLGLRMRYPIGRDIKNLTEITKVFVECILKLNIPKDRYINLLCRGSSGAIIAGIVASSLSENYTVTISHIKKDGESSHSGGIDIIPGAFNIIIDDFIETGSTMRAIYERFIVEGGNTINMLIVSSNISENQDIPFLEELDYLVCGHISDMIKKKLKIMPLPDNTENKGKSEALNEWLNSPESEERDEEEGTPKNKKQ